jgi:hypothetical protein
MLIEEKYTHLAKRELLQEIRLSVGLSENEVLRDFQVESGVLGSDQCLAGTEIVRICVKSLFSGE